MSVEMTSKWHELDAHKFFGSEMKASQIGVLDCGGKANPSVTCLARKKAAKTSRKPEYLLRRMEGLPEKVGYIVYTPGSPLISHIVVPYIKSL